MMQVGDGVCAKGGSLLAQAHGTGTGTVMRVLHLRDSARVDVLWDQLGPPAIGIRECVLEPIEFRQG